MNIRQIIISLKNWAGFEDKKLWNWLELLLVPIFLSIAGIMLEEQADKRREISDIRQAQQQSLKEYFKSVREIIRSPIKKNSSVNTENAKLIDRLSNEDKNMLETLTQLVFTEIDNSQKRRVIEFLYKLELIQYKTSFVQDSYKNIYRISLDKVDITEANLSNLDLNKINFQGANLNGANLTNTNLEFARFEESSVINAQFDLANLSNSSIKNATFGNTKKDFQYQNKLSKIQDIQASRGYLLKGNHQQEYCEIMQNKTKKNNNNADLDQSNSDFENANFDNLDLQGFIFKNTNLKNASIKNTNLANANFIGANLKNISTDGSYLNNIRLNKNTIKQFDIKHQLIISIFKNQTNEKELIDIFQKKILKIKKDLSFSNLSNISLIGKDYTNKIEAKNINFESTILVCSTFKNIDLSGSNLIEADLSNSTLNNVVLENTNLKSSRLIKAKINNISLRDADLFGANLSKATIENSNFKGTNLNSAILCGTNLLTVQNLDDPRLLRGALYDDKTQFPKYFNKQEAVEKGIIKKDDLKQCVK